jgi:hypothetical protein
LENLFVAMIFLSSCIPREALAISALPAHHTWISAILAARFHARVLLRPAWQCEFTSRSSIFFDFARFHILN